MKTINQECPKRSFSNRNKSLIIAVLFALLPGAVFAQQSVFDKYSDQEDITTVIVNKKTFELMGSVKLELEKEAGKYVNQIKNIDNFRMFSTSNVKIAEDMKQTFNSYRKKNDLEQLMSVSDEGKEIKIYVKSPKNSSKVKELLMFIEGGDNKGDETVLLTLTGNFDLANLE